MAAAGGDADARVARVNELTHKGVELLQDKLHFVRAAAKLEEAAAAAQALGAPDCLIVAQLQAMEATAQRQVTHLPTASVDVMCAANARVINVLLPAVWRTLDARAAQRTLLPGACRAAEVAWSASLRRVLMAGCETARERDAYAQRVGYETSMMAAQHAIDLLGPGKEVAGGVPLCTVVSRALDMLAVTQPGAAAGAEWSPVETLVVRKFHLLTLQPGIVDDTPATRAMEAAWHRLERSEAAAERGLTQLLAETHILRRGELSEGVADVTAPSALRRCALGACGARELHVAQFKVCAACRAACYCCSEHQREDWKAHKKACKAACAAKAGGGASSAAQ
jgi:hypothetical protein